jgi:hypothetical protein
MARRDLYSRERPCTVLPTTVMYGTLVLLLLTRLVSLGSCEPIEAPTTTPAASCPNSSITVVYNALVWPNNDWKLIVKGQLLDLRNSGLSLCSALHVVLSAPAVHPGVDHSQMEKWLAEGRDLIYGIIPARGPGSRTGAIVSLVHENAFEYHGVHLLWMLAKQVPKPEATSHLFLYFHSKGMVNNQGVVNSGRLTSRNKAEVFLFNRTVYPWLHVVDVFQANATISRAGLYPSPDGWMWFNFWWARASYIVGLVEPLRTRNRYYYERYLGRLHELRGRNSSDELEWSTDERRFFGGCTTCFSLCADSPGKTYTAHAAVDSLSGGCL